MNSPNPTRSLAEFAATIEFEDVPSQMIATQKAVLLDAVACAIASRVADVQIPELFEAARFSGTPPARSAAIFVSGARAPALAAYLNGALIHALVFDAAGASGAHIGMIAVAPVLAAAEASAGVVTGRDFLAASVAASEVHARLVRSARGPSRVGEAGWLDGQVLGAFGACAGAGRVLGLSAEEMESAFGITMMQASGTREIIRGGDPPVKALYGGPANLAGVLAALLAESGVDAAYDVLGGPDGILSGWFNCADLEPLLTGLRDTYLGGDVHFKEWPATGAVQPYVYAAQAVRAMAPVASSSIARVRLRAPAEEIRWIEPLGERLSPPHAALACNSIPYGLACTLLDGELWLERLSAKGLNRDDARGLLARFAVDLVRERADAALEVELTSGEVLATEIFNARTDNFGALAASRVEEKLRRCVAASAPLSEHGVAERICSLLGRLEELSDVTELIALLVGDAA